MSAMDTAQKHAALAIKLAEVGRSVAAADRGDVAPHDEAIATATKRADDLAKVADAPSDTEMFVTNSLVARRDRLAAHAQKWSLILGKDALATLLYPNDAAADEDYAWVRLRATQVYIDAIDKALESE